MSSAQEEKGNILADEYIPDLAFHDERIEFVSKILGDFVKVSSESIRIITLHNHEWVALIRTETCDLIFTHYSHDCWRIETLSAFYAGNRGPRTNV
jgi:hypothetical protein